MVMNDSGHRVSRASTMSNSAAASASVGSSSAPANADDSASTITVNTKAPPNFPPPKTDKPRPHVCATCQRSFARLEHLKRHERSHTKEKPFECPECSRCFARRDLLLRHQQKLHQTSTPSSRPRNRRESASGAPPGQSRARKNSVAGANPPGANAAAASMRPRANTISHVDGAAIQMIASANTSVPRGMHSGHGRHPSLHGLPLHNFDQVFGGVSMAMGQRGVSHGLPKLETGQASAADFDNALRTAPPLSAYSEFDFESLLFGPGSTINPNALHYNDSPPSMALEQASPFAPALNEISSNQALDDTFDWLSGFEHQMSFQTNENVVDESSPSALSTTSQSGISDVMLDGSNHPAPAGTSTMWQPSVMGPPQMPNPFAMDLNGSVFPDLLNGAPLSPQPASQKINDPYFSTPPPSLSSLSPSVVSGLNTQALNQTLGFNAGPDTPSSSRGANYGVVSPVTTITDATRTAIVNVLSQCPPFGGRKYSFASQSSSQPPQFQSAGSTASAQAANVPSTQSLQRYVGAYITYFHPHLPFLHLPTLSFDMSSSPNGRANGGVGGSVCLALAMAAIGALYEMEHAQSKEFFDMAKKTIFFYLEERRKADVRKADIRRSTQAAPDQGSPGEDSSTHTPVWLVQAMLLNVVYGHNCADKTIGDIASTHRAALVSLAQAADLLRPDQGNPTDGQDVRMTDDTNWNRNTEQEEWLQWKNREERKRTLYAVFIMSSLLVAAYNHTPTLTNSEILLDLPCDEELFMAESSSAFFAKGGVDASNRNRVKFSDALGELLRTSERNQRRMSLSNGGQQTLGSPTNTVDLPLSDLKPSTFGCLILINALHNYIWETRQRHHSKGWTNEETEKMHRHIEPALKAWQMSWASNPQHSVERPNPFGLGPLSADAIPLLDLAYVRLFVNLSRSKEKFWQRDWDGMTEELARGTEMVHDAEHSPAPNTESAGADTFDSSFFTGSPQNSSTDLAFSAASNASHLSSRPISRREKHLRKAAFYAADSLAMSDKLGVTFADFTSRELPLQSAMCAFDCAQVLAEWIATLQDRLGHYLGIIGQDPLVVTQMPAIMLLEEEDVKLLEKIREVLSSAEIKISLDLLGSLNGSDPRTPGDGDNGYASRILRVTAQMLDKAAVWPVTNLMARCLETHAHHMRARTEKSVVASD